MHIIQILYLLLILFFIILNNSHVSVSLSQIQHLKSCLNHHSLTNITLQTSDNHRRHLLHHLKNLRFNKPDIHPLAIISPSSHDQVVIVVRCSIASSVRILVRSGGHSYEGASSTSKPNTAYVILDMSEINNVGVDLSSNTAWVEGGATLGEVYHAIAKSTMTRGFAAGSCPSVGISGLVLGGGFGLLSRKYGLAADNVVDAILVNGLGQTLDRAAMGEEVFWALRGGGGGSWGVVTAWKIQLVWVPETVTGFAVERRGNSDTIAMLVYKWQLVGPRLNDEFYLSVAISSTFNTSMVSATFQGLFLGPMEEALAILGCSFQELELSAKECSEMSWIESVVYFSELHSENGVDDLKNRFAIEKHHFKAKSDYVKDPISIQTLKEIMKILEKEPRGLVTLDPYGGVMNKISSDSIAFPHRKGNMYSIQYMVTWEENQEERNNRLIDWIRGLYGFMEPYVSSNPRAAYVNYMDYDLGVVDEKKDEDVVEKGRVWGEKYFLGNYDKLVKIKMIVDPCNVFRHQQSIPRLNIELLRNTQFCCPRWSGNDNAIDHPWRF